MPAPMQGPAHGVGQERRQVVDVRSLFNLLLREDRSLVPHDDQAQVVRLVLRQRLRQCLEVGLPVLANLREAFQAALDKGHALAECQFLSFARHCYFLLHWQTRSSADQRGHFKLNGRQGNAAYYFNGLHLRDDLISVRSADR